MSGTGKAGEVREAVAVFHDFRDMETAIDVLLEFGFDRAAISLLAPVEKVDAQLGHHFESVADLEDNPAAPRVAYVSRDAVGDAEGAVIGGLIYVGALAGIGAVVSSGGALLPLIGAAAAGGTGGLVFGSLLAKVIGAKYGAYISDQLERGGLLLWVRTFDQDQEERATQILKVQSGSDVHIHGLSKTQKMTETHAGIEIEWYDRYTYWVHTRPFDSLEEARSFAVGRNGRLP